MISSKIHEKRSLNIFIIFQCINFFFLLNVALVNFSVIQVFTQGKLIPSGRVYPLLARLIPSGQTRPLKPGNKTLHILKLAECGLAMSPQDRQTGQGTDPICAFQLGWGGGGGGRSRLKFLSGAGTFAIVPPQDCELKMLWLPHIAESIEGLLQFSQTQNLAEVESFRQEEREQGGGISWSKTKQLLKP